MHKKLSKLFYLICFTSLLFSCNEKLNLIGEFKETAIVYGVLDQADIVRVLQEARRKMSWTVNIYKANENNFCDKYLYQRR